jgi:hypothetical protein
MLNPFFLQGSKSEQNLIQDLINEHLRMYGVDVHYIPRKYITEKTVIKEVIESKFNDAYPIEAYVDSFNGYEGAGDIMSKFGVQSLDDLTLIISKERYENYIKPLIEGKENIKLSSRPKEGDLIYFPLGDRLFEIKHVEHEKPFYQLQKNYVYELRCELFRYGNETIATGIDEIDGTVSSEGYIQTLRLSGIGSTATATCTIFNTGVRKVNVINRGSGYTSAPTVQFSKSPSGINATALGIATMVSGIVDFCETDSSFLRVQGVELTNTGYGYTQAPLVRLYGGGGSGAVAEAELADGVIGIITITSPGSGYVETPTVIFDPPPSGIGTAVARAYVSAGGTISHIRIIDAGIGYTVAPNIVLSNPYMGGSGKYKVGEEVIGSVSGTKALVKSWNSSTNELKVYKLTGDFVQGESVVGQGSSASYKLKIETSYERLSFNESFSDNKDIEIEADGILDFSQRNPFGDP